MLVDVAAYAANLAQTEQDIDEALRQLTAAGFIETRHDDKGWHVERVCPPTYQILGLGPSPHTSPSRVE
jgi:hypothetical protein